MEILGNYVFPIPKFPVLPVVYPGAEEKHISTTGNSGNYDLFSIPDIPCAPRGLSRPKSCSHNSQDHAFQVVSLRH